MLELEAPPNEWFAGTVAVTPAKRGLCGKPSLAARGLFEVRTRDQLSLSLTCRLLLRVSKTCSRPESFRRRE
jgi:hypothetical protein